MLTILGSCEANLGCNWCLRSIFRRFSAKKEYQKKVDLNYELKVSNISVFMDFG